MGTPILLVIVAFAGVVTTGATYRALSGRLRTERQAHEATLDRQHNLESQLAATRDELDTATAERDTLKQACEDLTDQRDSILGALADEHDRRAEADDAATALRDQLAGATATVPAHHPREADGCWALLLADVERRWAAVVGAPADLRGVHLGAVPDQLTEALTREIDRLREEVGVDISLKRGAAIEPADPVLFLLTATDLLGVLAVGCQRVTVEMDGVLTLTGNEWSGPTQELDAARARVLAAGATVGQLEVETDTPVRGDEAGSASGLEELTGTLDLVPDPPANEVVQVRLAVHPAG